MAAGAVEELASPSPDGQAHHGACLNCAAPLGGQFCHQCGQPAHVHRTLMAFVHDIAHGVFHFEGKIWRTLPLLMLRPGQLTRDYIAGKRVRYVSPIALFLFSVFLLFAVVKHVPMFNISNGGGSDKITVNGKTIAGVEANLAEVARLQGVRKQLVAQGKSTEDVDDEIETRQGVSQTLRVVKGDVAGEVGKAMKSHEKVHVYSKIPRINAAIANARENPVLALYKLESNAYKYAWALIPLSVPLVWLLFPFSRRFGLYDHTVFVTYSLCAMSLMVVVMSLMGLANLPGRWLVAVFYPPWHMYRQLKDAYGLSRLGALLRMWVLSIGALMALSMFSLVLAALEIGG